MACACSHGADPSLADAQGHTAWDLTGSLPPRHRKAFRGVLVGAPFQAYTLRRLRFLARDLRRDGGLRLSTALDKRLLSNEPGQFEPLSEVVLCREQVPGTVLSFERGGRLFLVRLRVGAVEARGYGRVWEGGHSFVAIPQQDLDGRTQVRTWSHIASYLSFTRA
jgi:hypothetical protein